MAVTTTGWISWYLVTARWLRRGWCWGGWRRVRCHCQLLLFRSFQGSLGATTSSTARVLTTLSFDPFFTSHHNHHPTSSEIFFQEVRQRLFIYFVQRSNRKTQVVKLDNWYFPLYDESQTLSAKVIALPFERACRRHLFEFQVVFAFVFRFILIHSKGKLT